MTPPRVSWRLWWTAAKRAGGTDPLRRKVRLAFRGGGPDAVRALLDSLADGRAVSDGEGRIRLEGRETADVRWLEPLGFDGTTPQVYT